MAYEMTNIVRKGDAVIADFKDGHVLRIIRNSGGHGMAEAIAAVMLDFAENTVVQFASRYQYPINYAPPFGFQKADSAYTLQQFMGYWKTAVDYAAVDITKHHELWDIIRLGLKDMREINQGEWPFG